MKEEEKVFNKLKHGTIFACAKCGSKEFELVTDVKIYDRLSVHEDGTVTVNLSALDEMNCNLEDVSRVYCAECGATIPRRRFLALIDELGDKIVLVPP
ncbi:MAG: hypothetical protein QXN56_06660 [Candidatus Hadarchaeum sp.]